MDRTGFSLIDQQFQKELEEKKKEITDRWTAHYNKKRYMGSEEMQKDAMAKDRYDQQLKIKNELAAYQAKLSEAHFGTGGRDEALKKIQLQEQMKKQRDQEAKQRELQSTQQNELNTLLKITDEKRREDQKEQDVKRSLRERVEQTIAQKREKQSRDFNRRN